MNNQRRFTKSDKKSLQKKAIAQPSTLPIKAKEIRDLLCNNNEKIINQLLCSICHEVQLEAVECSQCQHSYCKECIQNWLSLKSPINNQQCPMKCKNVQFNLPHLTIRQLIDGLEMRCPYSKNGCEKIITLQGLKNHIEQCQYKIEKCPNYKSGCEVKLLKMKINEHILLCEYAQWICNRCDQKCLKKQKPDHDCIKYLTEKISSQEQNLSQQEILLSYLKISLAVVALLFIFWFFLSKK